MKRRDVLLAGGAALLGAPARAAAVADPVRAVTALRRAELDAELAYRAADAPPRLARAASEHAAVLRTVLGALVAPQPPGPRRLEDLRPPVAGLAPALAKARGRRARAHAAGRIEAALRDLARAGIAGLDHPEIVRVLAGVLAAHAAEAAVLELRAGRDPLDR